MKALSICFLFCCGCSLAPILSTPTARPLGKGNFSGGLSVYTPTGGWLSYGITDKLEIGVSSEFQLGIVSSLNAQYSLMSGGSDQMALAVHGGGFYGDTGFGSSSGGFLGLTWSKKWNWFELVGLGRLNHGSWNLRRGEFGDNDESFFYTILFGDVEQRSFNFSYGQVQLGGNFWVSESFAITTSALIFITGEGFGGFPTAGVIYRPGGRGKAATP